MKTRIEDIDRDSIDPSNGIPIATARRRGDDVMAESHTRELGASEPKEKGATSKPSVWIGLALLALVCLGCAVAAYFEPLELPGPLASLLALPFVLATAFGCWQLCAETRTLDSFQLRPGRRLGFSYVKDAAHRRQDVRRYQGAARAAQRVWEHEYKRQRSLLLRMPLQAASFGTLTTLALLGCAILWVAPERGWISGSDLQIELLATSLLVASIAAFLVGMARVLVRHSGEDLTARTFAWAARELVYAVIADIGLMLVLPPGTKYAIATGLFAGFAGAKAIDVLLDKLAALFNFERTKPVKESPLLAIEGMTEEHVIRLQEEGILSVHDLAFVPTARLFFSTAYSLQQLCNWQDRALLSVYVGAEGSKALADKMQIRGAIDLMGATHRCAHADAAQAEPLTAALRNALQLDVGGMLFLCTSMEHDEATTRLRVYWSSVVRSLPDSSTDHDDDEEESDADSLPEDVSVLVYVSEGLSPRAVGEPHAR